MTLSQRIPVRIIGLLSIAFLGVILILGNRLQQTLSHVSLQPRVDTSLLSVSATETEADHRQYLTKWRNDHGIIFSTTPAGLGDSGYSWQLPDVDTHDRYIAYYQSFDEELSKYNAGFLANAGIKQIFFVDSIVLHGTTSLLGFADILEGSLYFNVEAARADTGLIKSTIHHEIAHILFYELYGSDMFTFKQWPTDADGYVSSYAQTSLAEDMAEVFAHIQTTEYQQPLIEAMIRDQIVRTKVQLVTQAAQAIDPSFNL